MKKNQFSWEVLPDSFTSSGQRCDAVFYRPEVRKKNVPVVIMAHGFAAEMRFGLYPFAEVFAGAGLAVFLFDYRGFGHSEGGIRHLVDPFRHRADWEAALRYVKEKPEINPREIVLWGSSFSGGHVLSVAADHPEIKAVCAQVPFLDGLATLETMKLKEIIQLTVHGVRDLVKKITSSPPHYIPVVGKPGSTACLNKADSWDGFLSLIPEGERSSWDNRCPARIALLLPLYRPVSKLSGIKSPCLIISADGETLFPLRVLHRAVRLKKDIEVVRLDCGHFDVYRGRFFQESVDAQLTFLQKHLFRDMQN